jgi:hypothetical protein
VTRLLIIAAIHCVFGMGDCAMTFETSGSVCLLTFAWHTRPALTALLIPSLERVVFADPAQPEADRTIGIYQVTNSSGRSARNFL